MINCTHEINMNYTCRCTFTITDTHVEDKAHISSVMTSAKFVEHELLI